ncbi:MAG: hypothetical protein UR56_C0006G0008 [Candidatus Roizmanbacteria bacterium GW2011_GWC2_34_23]|uniref:Methyltransferase domain-containing protein n=1 Tax=Candidatus Roizmanbacteria bacterium GW2011_GWC2_34_23 TaxID=1618484 RepID=A0A0G0E5U8_9BACT|nr:MAG: hypothetical protein UR56_C0006G0008 [Candidatus Roizmanbacteria bacterium GW2011_GWC2_34_23]
MGFFITFIIFITVIIFIFSSKKFSPIPYFPSQPADMLLIIKALSLKNNQTIFDLGAGDGTVIFKAAEEAFQQDLNTKFVAVEINPVLILILYLRRLFHKNRKNIKIIRDDIFKMDFESLIMKQSNNVTIYLYISPWYIERVIKNCKMKNEKFSVVSYMYPVKSLTRKPSFAKASEGKEIIQGKNKIFIY